MLCRRKSYVRRYFTPTRVSNQQLTPSSPTYAPEDPPEGKGGEEQAGDGAADEEEDSWAPLVASYRFCS